MGKKEDKMKAVCLLSGGMDSAVASAIAKKEGYEVYALSFDYGQRNKRELKASGEIAKWLQAKHKIIKADLRQIGGSALTDDIEVPEHGDGIPVTYVPARNTIFLSFALAYAEVVDADAIFIGVNAVDYSGYPDCRPEYIEAFEHMANFATKAGVNKITKIKIRTPLIHLTKARIIKKGIELGVDYSMTHSCYDPSPQGLACGQCDSCILRKKGFKEAKIDDPTKYI